METRRIYQAIAEAFHAEGVRTAFSLTGDGNMHWEAALAAMPGVHSYHVRHEHAAVAMASAWARKTGEVGVASVTCGPGLTQIMTALATAAHARIPLVVFSGEDPIDSTWYNQRIDQEPLVLGCGAAYVAARSAKLIDHHVMEAFTIARSERRPVVLAAPLDLQKQAIPTGTYIPSHVLMPEDSPRRPDPAQIERAVERIRAAKRIVILGGRGAHASGCRAICEELAEAWDAALTVTLPAKGLFEGNPRYIGVTGGFAHVATRAVMEQADLVLAVGASLSSHTSDANALFSPEDVIQIDPTPPMLKHGQTPARQHVTADAALALAEIAEWVRNDAPRSPQSGWDVATHAKRVMTEAPDATPRPALNGYHDPMDVAAALSKAAPSHWAHVGAAGHCAWFTAHIHGRDADNTLTIREFGAIGNGICYAAGRWAAGGGQPVMMTEGDGGFLMHVQELETVARYNMKILFCIFNDGAYGSEIHKLRADGLTDHGAVFGHRDLAALARGFGISGTRVDDLSQLPDLVKDFEAGDGPMLWDFHVSDQVMAPTMRRQTQSSPLRRQQPGGASAAKT
ncbi:thiamine pyrophosphate-binding protein [Oceanicola sp. 22II-s10i]|uniref:thiamine pyrophosphate-binding protein n=1 Tax=Oceanicola sp. 22II-s10i TaxID=1317116 RepID=UPI001595CFC1|nr:thiamine pyrophosphate-binding protein [Oceanicola sp. 22II-s10i]